MRWGLFPHEALTRSAYEQRQRQMLTTDWAVYHSNKLGNYAAVSYTHLTLPTKRIV